MRGWSTALVRRSRGGDWVQAACSWIERAIAGTDRVRDIGGRGKSPASASGPDAGDRLGVLYQAISCHSSTERPSPLSVTWDPAISDRKVSVMSPAVPPALTIHHA